MRSDDTGLPASGQLIAITGGAGFVGRHIIRQLQQQGYKIRALQNRQPIVATATVEIVQGSLTDAQSLTALVTGADAVIHAGALVAARSARDFMRVNAEGTDLLAKAAADAGVSRFLLISSLAASRPELSPYAASKRAGEAQLAAQPGLYWDVIRPPAIYGGDDPHLLTLFKLLQKRVALFPSGRNARVSLLHVDDLAAAVCAWTKSGGANERIYELDDRLNTEVAKTWGEVMALAAKILIVQPVAIIPPRWLLLTIGAIGAALARLSDNVSFITPGKARELAAGNWVTRDHAAFTAATGWVPQVPLAQGLSDTLSAYRQAGYL